MTDQPFRVTPGEISSRVTPGEISSLLDHARRLRSGASLDEQIAYHEHKALLLSRVAADLDTTEARLVAADAWHYVAMLLRRRNGAAKEVTS